MKVLLIAFWLCGVTLGMFVLTKYSNQPGKAALAPRDWPAASMIPQDTERPTLVMLAHPQCPCTRASINELARLMAREKNLLRAYVLFYQPKSAPLDWAHTDLWRSAEAIPGVVALTDKDGEQARIFGASTSGQTLLYDRQGRMIFSGGLTGARGHEGDNAGRSAIETYLETGQISVQQTFVFGCAITAETE